MKQWYAVHVRPRSEKKVAASLEISGTDYYLPLVTTLRQWSDRKKKVQLPLIPGYCFVHVEEREFLGVLQHIHVITFVKTDGSPAVIPGCQIEFIRRMLNQSEIQFELLQQMPKPGQEVEIIAGPMIGLRAEVVRTNKKSKVILRMEAIGTAIRVEVPLSSVMLTHTTEHPAD